MIFSVYVIEFYQNIRLKDAFQNNIGVHATIFFSNKIKRILIRGKFKAV